MSQSLVLKAPPNNTEAEISILGALMLDPDAWDQVQDKISEADFYKPAHQKLFATIAELRNKNQPVDVVMMSNLLQTRGELDSIGGAEYLIEILNKTVSSANVGSYSEIVREKSLLRKVINTSTQIIERAHRSEFSNVETFIDEVESEIFKIGNQSAAGGLVSSMEIVKSSLEKIEELFQRKSDITGIATGFTELDKMTAGLHPGELLIVAARPSMGKTAFALNMAQHMALRQKKTVAVF
ncbi:MAG: DnaB-like helicase N-terminal domain-containing protein, partial [Pseudobdellovibrionaceae bacterium]